MGAEGIERGRRSLSRSFTPPVISGMRLVGNFVALGEQHGQGLGLGRLQRHGDQCGTELVNAVPGETLGSERLAQRRADSQGARAVDGLLMWDGPGACLLGAFEDGGRGGGHHGEDLRALRVESGEGASQHIQGGSHVLHRTHAPLRRVGGVSQLARGDDRLFG
ncbi:hypothetical protein AB0P36_17660 [Streptomyces flavidovirens]|uniref:hypothetical protein n=1 Tax=Streptomyces flavidovirens TaxID=67298 RepID=UPI003427D182